MPADTQLSILDSAMTAWRDALAARERMPNLFWTVLAALLILNLIGLGAGALSWFAGAIYAIVQGFVLLPLLVVTPLAIPVHRFILLGETNDNYAIDTQNPRFMRFFLISVALSAILTIPSLVSIALVFLAPILSGIVSALLGIIAAIISIRTVILFPSIAVDAPGADWRNSMADTKGHSWRVFFIFLVTFLPVAIAVVVLAFIFEHIPAIGWIFIVAIQSVADIFLIAAAAALASRLYAAFANQLGRPAGVSAPR